MKIIQEKQSRIRSSDNSINSNKPKRIRNFKTERFPIEINSNKNPNLLNHLLSIFKFLRYILKLIREIAESKKYSLNSRSLRDKRESEFALK